MTATLPAVALIVDTCSAGGCSGRTRTPSSRTPGWLRRPPARSRTRGRRLHAAPRTHPHDPVLAVEPQAQLVPTVPVLPEAVPRLAHYAVDLVFDVLNLDRVADAAHCERAEPHAAGALDLQRDGRGLEAAVRDPHSSVVGRLEHGVLHPQHVARPSLCVGWGAHARTVCARQRTGACSGAPGWLAPGEAVVAGDADDAVVRDPGGRAQAPHSMISPMCQASAGSTPERMSGAAKIAESSARPAMTIWKPSSSASRIGSAPI